MESQPVEKLGWSLKNTATYLLIGSLLVGAWLVPDFLFTGYADLINTVILLGLYLLVVRAIVGSVLSISRPDVPAIPAETELPSVSIVIPAYNEEPVLPDAIQSCRDLDYPTDKLEVIICYEADSTDRTAEIAEAAADDDPLFRALEHEDSEGAKATAVNYALQHTTGDIIGQIDADHEFKRDAVRRAVAWFLDDEETWCVQGRCYGKNPTESIISLHATVERHIAELADLYGRQKLGGFTIFGGGQVFFRATMFEEIGLFDEEVLVEDIDMSVRIQAAGKRLRVDPEIITYEENPPTLRMWWGQRKRWARGWMQVARRRLLAFPTQTTFSVKQRLDATFTFTYAVIPALLIFSLPLPALKLATRSSTLTYLSNDWLLWAMLPIAPVLVAYPIFVRDYVDGLPHHPLEYLAPATLWLYFGLQSIVFVVALLDEFLLGKDPVFVTTSRSGESNTR